MNKYFTLLLSLFMSPFIATGLPTNQSKTPSSTTSSQASSSTATMVVKVDKREELFGILFRIAGAKEYRKSPLTHYIQDVDSHFELCKDHPAVKATEALRESNSISFDAPQSLLIYLDDQLMPRRKLSPLPPGLDHRWTGVNIDDYLAKVRDFAKVCKAEVFFAAHETYYHHVEERFRKPIEQENTVAWFDQLFGARSRISYIVVPGLLNGGNNYGLHAVFEDGHTEMYQVMSLDELDETELPKLSEETIELLVHELSHSYVNPFLESHASVLEPSLQSILKLVEKPMKQQAYVGAPTLANESLVRAIVVLYMKDKRGIKKAEALAQNEAYRSFYWVGDLAKRLEEYKNHRDKYKNIETFFPRIASFFEEVAKRYAEQGLPKLPFRGPINVVFGNRVVLIVPSISSETTALVQYLSQIQKKLFPSNLLMEVSGQTWADLPKQDIALYGSPKSNPLIDTLLRQNNWHVDRDGITVANKHFTGSGLVLIACRPHPNDAYRGVVIYTSAQDSDLVDINSLHHGFTDWVVAKHLPSGKFETVGQGKFE